MIGRRVTTIAEIERPGDYCGPIVGYTAGKDAVFFRLPIDSDEPGSRSLHHVTSPPHVFRECADGSVEIRESIGAYGFRADRHIWHGCLDEGHTWREC